MSASREADQLAAYAGLLRKWNPAINLVAPSTLPELEQRHLTDSRQLSDLVPQDGGPWLDVGSGGGLPGLVIAITRPEQVITLVDSDARKVAFLRTVIRELELGNCTAVQGRIEQLAPFDAAILSARALAPLDRLMPYVARHVATDGTAWLMKGRNWRSELSAARQAWSFDVVSHPSMTDPEAVILQITDVRRHG